MRDNETCNKFVLICSIMRDNYVNMRLKLCSMLTLICRMLTYLCCMFTYFILLVGGRSMPPYDWLNNKTELTLTKNILFFESEYLSSTWMCNFDWHTVYIDIHSRYVPTDDLYEIYKELYGSVQINKTLIESCSTLALVTAWVSLTATKYHSNTSSSLSTVWNELTISFRYAEITGNAEVRLNLGIFLATYHHREPKCSLVFIVFEDITICEKKYLTMKQLSKIVIQMIMIFLMLLIHQCYEGKIIFQL